MLREAQVTAFLGATDLDRARAFFEGVLGLPVQAQDNFALVLASPSGSIRVSHVREVAQAPYTVLGWNVADLRSTVVALGQRGVGFTRYAGMNQDELGVWSAPGGARVAWFQDPDGNVLSITEHPA